MIVHDLVIYEFLCGNLSPRQAEAFEEQIKLLPIISLNPKAIRKAARIYREQRAKGRTIGSFDAIISAGYKTEGINQIVTRNVRHYENLIKTREY